MPKPELRPPICDYEGSNYRTEFWEGRGRDYEDRVERIALHRLLRGGGRRLLEVGAGFGRLSDEFAAYEQVVLLDYSFSQMQYAQEHHGRSPHFVYVAADAYHLPFKQGAFDAATMIRVIHHMANVPRVVEEINRVLIENGVFILEHANKRHLKSVARYAFKQQDWSPYTHEPVEFVELNFDFHPQYIADALAANGFKIERRVPVSFFRVETLKKSINTQLLSSIDGLLQTTGLLVAPSVFIRSHRVQPGPSQIDAASIFACPACGGDLLHQDDELVCPRDLHRYAIRDGIYDFKAPIED
ncbi:MAG TPA: methyltransferase domain-containing protein [Candidatus Limnocylindrales bacterium]|nr:methyltransferase domain-containing protein [Candidatus Limnocylindrales bacterium]